MPVTYTTARGTRAGRMGGPLPTTQGGGGSSSSALPAQWTRLPAQTKKKVMYGSLVFAIVIGLIFFLPYPGKEGASASGSSFAARSEQEDDDDWPEVPWWERNPEEASRIRKMRAIINHIHASSGQIESLVEQEHGESKLENKTDNLRNIKHAGREIFDIADNARSLVTTIVPPNPPSKPSALKHKCVRRNAPRSASLRCVAPLRAGRSAALHSHSLTRSHRF